LSMEHLRLTLNHINKSLMNDGEEKSTINYNKFIDNFFDNEDKKTFV